MPFDLRIDRQKNRLYIKIWGLIEDEELRAGAGRTIKSMESLRPGFTIVNDISECRPLSQEGVEEVRRVAEMGVKHGMRAVARVVGASTITRLQFKRVSREAGYDAYTATSMAEAESMLDQGEGGSS